MNPPAAAAAAFIYTFLYLHAGGGAAEADERDLVAAARAGDRGALELEARRIGAHGIARLILSSSREIRQAALAAAPFAPDPWVLGPELLGRLDDPDRPSSTAAARALAEIAQGLDRQAIETADAPSDEIGPLAKGCAAAARRVDLAPDVRVHALECAAALGDAGGAGAEGGDAGLAADLLADPEPEVRRAAIYRAPAADAGVRATLARGVAGEADVEVAATAGAALCRADAGVALAAMSTEGRARLRALAVDPLVEPGVVIGLIRCLRAGDAEDGATLARLAKKGARTVRDHLRRK